AARVLLGATLGVALATALVALRVPAAHREHLDLMPSWPDTLTALAAASAGAWVLLRRAHPLGWVMAGFGLWWMVDTAAGAWLAEATTHDPALPGASVAFWVYQRLGAGLLLLLPLVLLLHPDGRLPRGRWRVAALVSLASTALLPVVLVVVPSDVAQEQAGTLPAELARLSLDPFRLPLPDGFWDVLLHVSYVLLPLSLLTPLAVVVARYRTSSGLRRTRMRWLLWAALMDALLMLGFRFVPAAVTSYGLMLCVALTAGAVAIALTEPEVVDIDALLGSTVVYGVLVVASFGLDVLVLGAAGKVLDAGLSGSQSLLVSVFVVSLVYLPLRHRVWDRVRRIARGERHDPYRVVSRLAERLESSDDPDEQLLEVARAVARAFRSTYVGVEVIQADGGRTLAEQGDRPREVEAMSIAYRGEEIGRLLLPAGPRRTLRPADARLLADVVRQAATVARTARLADELQASRERLVTAVEDERRRLRNELHDGLGPTLAAVASRIDTARLVAPRDAEASDRMLGQARAEITDVLAEVRRLVYGLRPPALDDVGLLGAIGQQVERLGAPGLAVRLDVPDRLPSLPAAVEVAALRIVSESLTNVLRHAGAGHCTVALRLGAGGPLVVSVTDDGVGIGPDVAAGVGLVSLRERAAELGGRCTVTAAPGGGTEVRAVLPVRLPAGEPQDVHIDEGVEHVG
ncbi:MAG: histidine kinase, partial [Angustibacter sp.]